MLRPLKVNNTRFNIGWEKSKILLKYLKVSEHTCELQVEVAHYLPHEVLVYHDVISNEEADEMKRVALPRVGRNYVGK